MVGGVVWYGGAGEKGAMRDVSIAGREGEYTTRGGDALCRASLRARPRSTRACARCSGDEATDAAPSDDSEGEERDRRVFLYELVHRCLEWATRAAGRRLPLMWEIS